MAKKFDRKGNVAAHDVKYTGEEPVFTEDMPHDEFMKNRSRMLGFYNYYLDKQSMGPDVEEYIRREMPKTKLQQSVIQSEIPFTAMKLMRAANRGMPLKTEETDDLEYVNNCIKKAESTVKPVKKVVPAKKAAPKTSQAESDVHEILCDLDQMYDKWVAGETKKPVGINLGELVKIQKIKNPAPLVDWLQSNINELTRALEKKDEFAVEGYSFLNKPSLRKWIQCLEDMKTSIVKAKKAKKVKTARKKKVKTPAEQTKHLKFAERDSDTAVEGMPVQSIIGAMSVTLYNTKYRDVNVIKCASAEGFSVKGQALQNVDEKNSYAIKLRKPEKDLQPIKDSKNPDKYIKGLTSKPKKANIRFNDNVMVLNTK